MARMQRITQRPTWGHRYVLPEETLARALSIVGDASRIRRVAMQLVLGEEEKPLPPCHACMRHVRSHATHAARGYERRTLPAGAVASTTRKNNGCGP